MSVTVTAVDDETPEPTNVPRLLRNNLPGHLMGAFPLPGPLINDALQQPQTLPFRLKRLYPIHGAGPAK